MLEVLQFIFRDLWTFCGTIILIYVLGAYCITAPLGALACVIHGEDTNKKKDSKENTNKKKDSKENTETVENLEGTNK